MTDTRNKHFVFVTGALVGSALLSVIMLALIKGYDIRSGDFVAGAFAGWAVTAMVCAGYVFVLRMLEL